MCCHLFFGAFTGFWCWNGKELTRTFRPSVWWQNVGTIEDQRETWLLWIYLNICKNDGEYLQQCLSSRDKTSSLECFAPHEKMIKQIFHFWKWWVYPHLDIWRLKWRKVEIKCASAQIPGLENEIHRLQQLSPHFCAFLINVSPPIHVTWLGVGTPIVGKWYFLPGK